MFLFNYTENLNKISQYFVKILLVVHVFVWGAPCWSLYGSELFLFDEDSILTLLSVVLIKFNYDTRLQPQ